jgi:NAD(P)-dependent dehydrogenase (short-subunit alcohol dehydrogenase family)
MSMKKRKSQSRNYLDKFSLCGKVAFVCGGTGLIGTEIVRAMAYAGARTIILDVNRKDGLRLGRDLVSQGLDAHFEALDITDSTGLEKHLARLAREYGPPDIWVNTAYPRTKDWAVPLEQLSVKTLQKNVDGHLNSYIWSTRVIALMMQKSGIQGSIINLGSIYGVQGNDFSIYKNTGIVSPMPYSSIKGGIINGTRYFASYFGKSGIRVNSLCPGGVWNDQDKRFLKRYNEKVPLGRMARSEEIASVALFLASDASSYMTGATVMVDGGWTII